MTPEQMEAIKRAQQAQAISRAQQQPDDRNWFQRHVLPDDDPDSHNAGETVAAAINKAGEALTFGLVGDEADAWVKSKLGGGSYDEELAKNRKQEEVLERDNPGLALTAEIGGSMAAPLGALGAVGKGAGMFKRMLTAGAATGGMSSVFGFMEGEGGFDERMKEGVRDGAIGGGIGALIPFAGSGVQRVANALKQRGPKKAALKAAKTAAAQRSSSKAQYDVFEGADAQFSAPAMERIRNALEARIQKSGAPNIPGALGKTPKSGRQILDTITKMNDEVQRAATAGQNPAVPLRALEDVRKQAGRLGREVDNIGRPTHGAQIAQQAVDEIDQFVDALTPQDMPVGDVEVARTALKKARALWRTSRKTQMVENAIDQSDIYLSGRESGLRNQIKSLLRRNKKENLFSPQEEEVLKKVIGNNMMARAVRTLGDGLGRKAAMLTGGAMGGLEGVAIGAAAGEAASQIGETAAMRRAEIARALIASGALQNLPEAPDAIRKITEQMLRQGTAAALPQ